MEIALSTVTEIEAVEEKCDNPALSREFEKINNIIQFKMQNMGNQTESICQNSNFEKGELEKMPYIRLRKDGRFEAVLSFKGKHFSVYDRDKNKLQIKITKKTKELVKEYKNQKSLAETKKDRLTVESWYKEWLEQDKKPFIKPKTLEIIENCFKKHILDEKKGIGKVKLIDLNKNIIQKFLNGMGKSRIKEITTSYLKSCITQAYKERYIKFNPFDTVKVEKKIKSDKVGFTASQQETILNYLKETDKDFHKIILFYLCTGCRRNELLSISKKDIQGGYVLIKGTKTSNAVRYVNISKDFETLLSNNIEVLNKYPYKTITRKFKRILEDKLKIKQGSIHSLRHCFITNHFYLGTPAKQVQSWVGHSTINLTLDIYTNLNPTIEAKSEKETIKNLYNNLYYYSE